MKIVKKIWITIPVVIWILANLFSNILERHELVLRSKPNEILFWVWVISIILVACGIGICIYKWGKQKQGIFGRVIAACLNICLALGGLVFLGFCFFVSAFTYQPEHVVERENIKMVACVDSFTDVKVYYYEYKGKFFRGKQQLGEEWYGSGGYDPFTTNMQVKPKQSSFYKNRITH